MYNRRNIIEAGACATGAILTGCMKSHAAKAPGKLEMPNVQGKEP